MSKLDCYNKAALRQIGHLGRRRVAETILISDITQSVLDFIIINI